MEKTSPSIGSFLGIICFTSFAGHMLYLQPRSSLSQIEEFQFIGIDTDLPQVRGTVLILMFSVSCGDSYTDIRTRVRSAMMTVARFRALKVPGRKSGGIQK